MIGPEVELVERCLAGEAVGTRTFVETFHGPIFGLCYRMVGQREDAEDITQEVFTRAFRSLKGWDRVRPLKPWLLMIAANCCRTALVKRARQATASEAIDDVPARRLELRPPLMDADARNDSIQRSIGPQSAVRRHQ